MVHLQAAVECLLKYRLELEHWSLVFKNPGDAKYSKLDDGSLDSCTVDQTVHAASSHSRASPSAEGGEMKPQGSWAGSATSLQHYGPPATTPRSTGT
ncbi:hypothetical protein ACGRHY_26330 [Streptomyces sp. HK10]|uniref:hypothetical protein n=1 Tax=Streptomyces sp. HK10 TaxID=3373255 RepID=UPI0037481430